METTAMPTGIRPIERPQGPQTTGVQRRGTPSASPFAPRTDVSLQNSVSDVANLLSKIASTKEEAMDKISPQLQKLIDSIMQQSFSLESTLAEGLGTTLESQRFAMDQMFTLARMLHQMGSLAEQGKPAALSDELQAVFAGVKEMMMAGEGKDMAPTMLHKLAFDILDGKQADELPEMMQFLLAHQQGASMPAVEQPESDAFNFMKQLMDYFMPRPGADKTVSTQEQGARQGASQMPEETANTPEAQTAQGRSASESGATREMPGTWKGMATEGNEAPARNGEAAPKGGETVAKDGEAAPKGSEAATKEGGTAPTDAENATKGSETAQKGGETAARAAQEGQKNVLRDGAVPEQNAQTGEAKEGAAQQKPQGTLNQNAAEQTKEQQSAQQTQQAARGQSAQTESTATRRGGESNASIYAWENEAEETQAETSSPDGIKPQDPFAELMRKGLERMRGRLQQQTAQPQQNEQGEMPSPIHVFGKMQQSPAMQNTPRMMEAMKQLASMVMENAQLTQEDEQLLLNFVNNEREMLSEKDARELQALLQLCEKNVPASVLQSAQQKGLEDLPRLWAFMQLCDLAMIKERDGKSLKRAGKSLSDFASMMKNSLLPENGRTPEGHRSMSFMTPLYMSEDMQKPYPAYIHVYDEDKKDENGGPSKKETWIRVCLLTENIGAVDVSFRMYEETNLDVRIYFSERENLDEFRDYMDEFRASFDDKPLTLMSVKVGVAGAKT